MAKASVHCRTMTSEAISARSSRAVSRESMNAPGTMQRSPRSELVERQAEANFAKRTLGLIEEQEEETAS